MRYVNGHRVICTPDRRFLCVRCGTKLLSMMQFQTARCAR